MYKNKILLIALSIILLFTSGCATVPRKTVSMEALSSQAIRIDGRDYLPLTALAAYYQMKWEWDSIAKKAQLTKDDNSFIFYAGMRYALVNGRLDRLRSPVVYHEGAVVIPLDFAVEKIAKLLGPSRVIVKHPPVLTQRYAIRKVVIDAGHGGMDPGAIGKAGLKEKDVVLDIARCLKDKLKASGIEVVLTRDRDKFISLSKRTQIANNNDVDFFISVHANANRTRSIKGFEAYYLSDAVDDTARAAEAAENSFLKLDDPSFYVRNTDLEATVWDLVYTENRQESIEMARYIAKAVDNGSSLKSRGIRSARFYVLKWVQMPSVLIEVGYISNPEEEKDLKNPSYRKVVVAAIAKGILEYKKIYEETDGFTR